MMTYERLAQHIASMTKEERARDVVLCHADHEDFLALIYADGFASHRDGPVLMRRNDVIDYMNPDFYTPGDDPREFDVVARYDALAVVDDTTKTWRDM